MSTESSGSQADAPCYQDETNCLVNEGDAVNGFRSLVTPVYRASTVVFPTVEAYQNRQQDLLNGYWYGLYGTPTTRALEQRLSAIEGANHTILTPSGMAAIALITLAEVKPGQRVLFPDNVYDAVRFFAANYLQQMGITPQFYDPMAGGQIEDLLTEDVALVWVESPGSISLEVQDVPAIVSAARSRGIPIAADNTWATAMRFKPLHHGVHYSMNSASKYISGHSDVVIGAISVRDKELYTRLRQSARSLGYGVAADVASLVIRGLETLSVRLDQSERSALDLARWLTEHEAIETVLHPAFEGHEGHAVWKRDFLGATGVFSMVLAPWAEPFVARAVESLKLIKIGASWGGTHSVIAVYNGLPNRTVAPWSRKGAILRLSIGLENVDDLKKDLSAALSLLIPRR